jgi:hypothetical protein
MGFRTASAVASVAIARTAPTSVCLDGLFEPILRAQFGVLDHATSIT